MFFKVLYSFIDVEGRKNIYNFYSLSTNFIYLVVLQNPCKIHSRRKCRQTAAIPRAAHVKKHELHISDPNDGDAQHKVTVTTLLGNGDMLTK